jgi:hypothetical protein
MAILSEQDKAKMYAEIEQMQIREQRKRNPFIFGGLLGLFRLKTINKIASKSVGRGAGSTKE